MDVRSDYRGLKMDVGSLSVKPLTLLLGPNNGGKSQYLRAMVVASAARRTVLDDGGPQSSSFAQELIDIGFRDLADELGSLIIRERRPILVEIDQEIPRFETPHQLMEYWQVRQARRTAVPEKEKVGDIATFRWTIDLDKAANDLVVSRLDIVLHQSTLGIRLRRTTTPSGESREETAYGYSRFRNYEIDWIIKGEDRPWREVRDDLLSKVTGTADIKIQLGQSGAALAGTLLRFLPDTSFLGPVRLRDDRDYSVAAARNSLDVGRAGEFTWARLKQLDVAGSPGVREWLSSNIQLVLGITDLRTGRDSPTQPRVTGRWEGRDIPLHDFGLGTSQVIPVLVLLALERHRLEQRALMGRTHLRFPAHRIVMVEEPESHLHPAAQKALAAACVSFVQAGGRLVIETHSETMLRFIEYAIADGLLQAAQVSLNWVDFRSQKPVTVHLYDGEGTRQAELPPSFDQVNTKLIHDKLFGVVKNA